MLKKKKKLFSSVWQEDPGLRLLPDFEERVRMLGFNLAKDRDTRSVHTHTALPSWYRKHPTFYHFCSAA